MGRRVMILAAGVGSGHNMAAGAIEAALADLGGDDEVRRLDILETTSDVFNRLYDDAYFALVSEAPWLVGWGYDNADPPFKMVPFVKWLEQLNTIGMVRDLREYDPDVVICTHFLPARLVSLMLARKHLHAKLTVVTTDFDFQGLWLTSPFHHFFAARDESRQFLISTGVPADRVTDSGIPVGPGPAEPVDREAILQRFDLRPDVPVVLISAGAAGGPYTTQIVQQTLRMANPFQAVVVCGRNTELKDSIEALVAEKAASYRVLGYTTEMAELMRVATLFVGKPGGLSSSECMAAGLPMVIINPIPGQEVRNADYLLEEGAAVRCNYATTVGYKLDQLLADPGRVERMAANANRIGRPNAGRDVAITSLAADPAPLWISRDAQRSMLQAGEQGVAPSDLEPGRRLCTLSDLASGGSLAVVTRGQLEVLGQPPGATTARLALPWLNALRWQPENVDLATTGRWILGTAEERVVTVS